jgi:hypothetical protein
VINLLRLFPAFCLIAAALSVFADINGLISFFVWGVGERIDLTQPFGFQAVMLTIRAIIQSLQWVAYGVLAELLIRHLHALGAFPGQPLSISVGRANDA